MSGGVDSSVVAGMLHARGEHVIGLTMQLWNQRRLPEVQSGASHRPLLLASTTSTMHDTWRSIWVFRTTWSISNSDLKSRW